MGGGAAGCAAAFVQAVPLPDRLLPDMRPSLGPAGMLRATSVLLDDGESVLAVGLVDESSGALCEPGRLTPPRSVAVRPLVAMRFPSSPSHTGELIDRSAGTPVASSSSRQARFVAPSARAGSVAFVGYVIHEAVEEGRETVTLRNADQVRRKRQ